MADKNNDTRNDNEQDCSCNDESLVEQKICFNCKETWEEQMPKHIRVSNCPSHHDSIAICGGGPSMCKKCKEDGYYVETSFGFGSIPTIKKRTV